MGIDEYERQLLMLWIVHTSSASVCEFCTHLCFYLITATTAWLFSRPRTFLCILPMINVLLVNHRGIWRQRKLLVWNAAIKNDSNVKNYLCFSCCFCILHFLDMLPQSQVHKHSQKRLKALFAFTFKHMWTTSGLLDTFCPQVWLAYWGSDCIFAHWYGCRHVLKYSCALDHEWHVHGTFVLVFCIKAWTRKGHLLTTVTNVRVGYLQREDDLQAAPEAPSIFGPVY